MPNLGDLGRSRRELTQKEANVNKSIVSRDDRLSRFGPDIVTTKDGTLVCAFRESDTYPRRDPVIHHLPGKPGSRVSIVRSFDEGATWGPVEPVCGLSPEEGSANCPRLCRLPDGSILLVVDVSPGGSQEEMARARGIWLWRSKDSGKTWEGPEKTPVYGSVPSLKQLRDGTLLCGTSTWNEMGEEKMMVHRSGDLGLTWEGPVSAAEETDQNFSEGDFVELDNGVIVCYLREEKHPPNSLKTLSEDGGRTWQGPYRTGLLSCLGRPAAGLLRSGEVVVTYRCDYSGMFCMYVESQEKAAEKTPLEGRVFGRNLMLDMDRGAVGHYGYSGWTQLHCGDIFVVQHIIDDTPPARHVRGYRIERRDWTMTPEPQRSRASSKQVSEPLAEVRRPKN